MKKIAITWGFLCLIVLPVLAQATVQDYKTTYDYLVRFYPRWFTWMQASLGASNLLAGPAGMGPEYGLVVAINDDTIYASAILDLSQGPQILTVPAYPNVYSILQLDVFGSVYQTGLQPTPQGGTYALVGPQDADKDVSGLAKVVMPYNAMILIFRIDKYSSSGTDQIEAAKAFRATMQLRSFADYQKNPQDPTVGKTAILPLYIFSPMIKRIADETVQVSPITFLRDLQQAMASSLTAPLNKSDKKLIRRFNRVFKGALRTGTSSGDRLADVMEGARAAHRALIDRWQSNTGPTNWVHFDNIGDWGKSYLDRAALTEYIQYGNNSSAAYYAQAFMDEQSVPLDGSRYDYIIRFPKDQIPQAERFWSITAYTPEDVELVSNSLNKYLVASYTPGLVTHSDGSVTVYLKSEPPIVAPSANWLPIPDGPFNVMLRIYGPKGAAATGNYVPPTIQRLPRGLL